MKTDTVHALSILLPDLDPQDLDEMTEPPSDEDVTEALIRSDEWVRARLSHVSVRHSRFDAANFSEALISGCRFNGNEFHRVDLTSVRIDQTTFERCAFIGCRLTAATFADVTFKDVIFRDCRLDYARFEKVRTTGPLGIDSGTLTEAVASGSTLTTFAVARCRLDGFELDQCDLRGADLRQNDLSGVRGVLSLRGVTIDDTQLTGLADALAADLDLTVKGPDA